MATLTIEYKNGATQLGVTINDVSEDIASTDFKVKLLGPALGVLQRSIDQKNGIDPLRASLVRAGLDPAELDQLLQG